MNMDLRSKRRKENDSNTSRNAHGKIKMEHGLDVTCVVIPPFQWEAKDCDMALCIGQYKYYAHSVVLSKESPVFERMLNGEWKERSDMFNITLNETPICSAAFKDFVRFFYMGGATCSSLSWANLMGMLTLADKYDVKELYKKCDEYIGPYSFNCVTFDSPMTIGLLTFLFEKNFSPLYERVKAHTVKHFEEVFKGAPYVSPAVLIDLLQSSDICVQSEDRLFGYVERWIQKLKLEMNFIEGPTTSSYEEIAAKILERVRFYFISSDAVLQSDLCGRFGSVLIEKLSQAAKAKAGKLNAQANKNLCTPRNYSNSEKSNTTVTLRFTVENFSNLQTRTYSLPVNYQNLNWRILAVPVTQKENLRANARSLGVYIVCECNNSNSWCCRANMQLRLLAQNNNTKSLIRNLQSGRVFSESGKSWGFSNYICWNDVLDESKGYIKNNSIILEASVSSSPPTYS